MKNIKASLNVSGSGRTYKEIELILIDTEGQSVRESIDDDHVVELAMSISKHGLLQPILLRPKEDGRYQLLAGFHRLTAFYRLNKNSIPSHIITDDPTPTKGIALIENIIRRDMKIEEECNAVDYLYNSEKLSPSQICDLLGKSRSWVDVRLSIPNYPDNVRKELIAGKISLRVAELLSRLKDDSMRAILLNNAIQQNLTSRQVEELCILYEESPGIGAAIEEGYEVKQKMEKPQAAQRHCDNCGRLRLLQDIRFWAICIEGCENIKD